VVEPVALEPFSVAATTILAHHPSGGTPHYALLWGNSRIYGSRRAAPRLYKVERRGGAKKTKWGQTPAAENPHCDGWVA
jgi:hypothetical protein